MIIVGRNTDPDSIGKYDAKTNTMTVDGDLRICCGYSFTKKVRNIKASGARRTVFIEPNKDDSYSLSYQFINFDLVNSDGITMISF